MQTAFAQPDPISTFHPLNSKSYGIAEGLPDRCVDYAFVDNLGKLNIIPCQHAQISYGQLIYQINGYQPFLKDVIVDSLVANLMIHSLGMKGDSINFGRVIQPGKHSEGDWNTSYFYTFRPDNGAFSYFEVTNEEGNPISIFNVIYEAGKYIACGAYRKQAYLFEILDSSIIILDEVELDRTFSNKRNISPLFKWEGNYLWLLDKTIYKFVEKEARGTRLVDLAAVMGPNASNVSILPGKEHIFAHSSEGKIYRTDHGLEHFSAWYPPFLSFEPQRSYMFKDNQGNILFSFHKNELSSLIIVVDC